MDTEFKFRNWWSLERVFAALMWVKAIDGFIETVGGLLLFISTSATITSIARILTQDELSEDPNDFVANFILRAGQKLGDVHLFGSLYLISHGAVKMILVFYLLKKDTRVYPWAIGFLTLFLLYQLYVTLHHLSLVYLALSLVDAFIIYMAYREYGQMTRKTAHS